MNARLRCRQGTCARDVQFANKRYFQVRKGMWIASALRCETPNGDIMLEEGEYGRSTAEEAELKKLPTCVCGFSGHRRRFLRSRRYYRAERRLPKRPRHPPAGRPCVAGLIISLTVPPAAAKVEQFRASARRHVADSLDVTAGAGASGAVEGHKA